MDDVVLDVDIVSNLGNPWRGNFLIDWKLGVVVESQSNLEGRGGKGDSEKESDCEEQLHLCRFVEVLRLQEPVKKWRNETSLYTERGQLTEISRGTKTKAFFPQRL